MSPREGGEIRLQQEEEVPLGVEHTNQPQQQPQQPQRSSPPLRLSGVFDTTIKCAQSEITGEAYGKVMDDLMDLAKNQIEQ